MKDPQLQLRVLRREVAELRKRMRSVEVMLAPPPPINAHGVSIQYWDPTIPNGPPKP